MCVHALHTVHALPDLRIAAGRFWDGFHDATDRFSLGSLGRASDAGRLRDGVSLNSLERYVH